jgi:hypothetical protein
VLALVLGDDEAGNLGVELGQRRVAEGHALF